MPLLRHHAHARAGMYGLARRAEFYERQARRHFGSLYRRVAADVTEAGLDPGAVVLDLGTGPGLVPLMIAAANPELVVTGVDLSTEMITRASTSAERHAEAGRPPVRFQVADVADLPFPDGSVDLVISSISLHHWADPAAGLREVVRVLKPGAQGWIYDFRWTLRRAERHLRGLTADVDRESPTAWFNPIARLRIRRTD